MTDLPLVGVLIPVYNEEAHIEECVESVLAQTHANWRLVAVDNASQDRTFEILQRYAGKDSRISVVRNPKTTDIVENYNIAGRQLAPEASFCKYIGGDDWLYPTCLEEMVKLGVAHPNVGLIGAYSRARGGVDPFRFPFPGDVVSGRDVMAEFLLHDTHLVGAQTPLMYRADLVRRGERFFRSDKLHTDVYASLEILSDHDYGFVQQVLTFTRERPASMTAFADRVNVYIPNQIEFLLNFGAVCFEEAECKRLVADRMRRYYNNLGEQVFRKRDKEYWDYQRGRLAELGRPLNHARLALNAFFYAAEAAVQRVRWRL
jgi:glycosyltransferase involved in cell wall biosynthesis